MIPVLDMNAWTEELREPERLDMNSTLTSYEHHFGTIYRGPRLILAPLDDHFAHRDDGMPGTVRFTERKIIHLDARLWRFTSPTAGLPLTLPCPIKEIRDIMFAVAKTGDEPEGNIYTLSRRGPGEFDIALEGCPWPSLYMAACRVPVRTDAWYDKDLTAFRNDVPVKPVMFVHLRTIDYPSVVFIIPETVQRHMDIALTFNMSGCLIEAAVANIAVIDAKGALVFPEFKNTLASVVVTKAMELAKVFIPAEIHPVPQAELDSTREMMILGTAHECIGVTHSGGRSADNGRAGPVTHKLHKLIRKDLLSGGEAF